MPIRYSFERRYGKEEEETAGDMSGTVDELTIHTFQSIPQTPFRKQANDC